MQKHDTGIVLDIVTLALDVIGAGAICFLLWLYYLSTLPQ